MAHEANSESFNDGFHAALDKLAMLPLTFVALLGFFVLATVVLEDAPRTTAAVVQTETRG